MTRRQLLAGRDGGIGRAGHRPGRGATASRVGDLVRYRRRAMGCLWEVLVPETAPACAAAVLEGFALVERLESLMSAYRPESALSRINARAAAEAVWTEPELFELLWQARELHRSTDGAFDPTVTPLLRAWGFRGKEGKVPSPALLAEARACVGMSRWVELDRVRHSVRFGRAGVELDLGAIGKGYAVARVCQFLAGCGVTSVLVHAGQSAVAALGSPPWEEGWLVAISDPLRPEQVLTRVRLHEGAMSTSGARERSFMQDGHRYGHILDPRTGSPAGELAGATVFAPSATEADALSTACYVLGRDGTSRCCERHPEVGVLLACSCGNGGGYDVARLGAVARYGEVFT